MAKLQMKDILSEIRRAIAKWQGGERELYEELLAEAEGWQMRLDELDEIDTEA